MLSLFNNFRPEAVITQRSALRLGPELANEKVRKIKKSAHTLKKKWVERKLWGR